MAEGIRDKVAIIGMGSPKFGESWDKDTEALRGACYAVASGAYDIVLALGVEKLKDTGYGGLPGGPGLMGSRNALIMPKLTAPGGFAMMATRYFSVYGLSPA